MGTENQWWALGQGAHQLWNLVKSSSGTKGMLLWLAWMAATQTWHQMCPSTHHSPGV